MTERGLERLERSLGQRAGRRDDVRIGRVSQIDLNVHRRRADCLELFRNQAEDFLRILIRHETHGDLRAGCAWHDGFAPLALVAAGEAVDLERRPRGTLLVGREAFFAKEGLHASRSKIDDEIPRPRTKVEWV